jgi:pimeloyl-ACP methyl ester carboxylesterase
MTDAATATVSLPDGRTLAYAEYGDRAGEPVVLCHGTPGSRLVGRLLDDAAADIEVRLVVPDRPGMGRSDHHPERTLPDWPSDVLALTERLGIDRFGVVGFSAGGAYALACADRLGDRIEGVGLLSSVTPPPMQRDRSARSQVIYAILSRAPWLARAPFRALAYVAKHDRQRLYDALASNFPRADRELLADERTRRLLFDDFAEAFRQGTVGPAHDSGLLADAWAVDPADVRQPVSLWHGRADQSVHPEAARGLAATLPSCRRSLLDDEAHFSTLVTAGKPAIWQATRAGRPEPSLD